MNNSDFQTYFAKGKRYLDYPHFMKTFFDERIQKISIHAGFSCPNRDGTKGYGGCTFCNNESFSPAYCSNEKSISKQIQEGIHFFGHKHHFEKFIAYFQSYTNTYGNINSLINLYEEALAYPNVVGLAIGTRPDCISNELLKYLAELKKRYFILVEYGVESTNDETLNLVNRQHKYINSEEAIIRTAENGILVAAHIIIGLPSETNEMIIEHAKRLAILPVSIIKLHQLQIIKNTTLAKQYEQKEININLYSLEEYIDVCIDFMEWIPPHICMERFVSQTPKEYRIAPNWGIKNHEFIYKLDKRMLERNTYQGRLFLQQ